MNPTQSEKGQLFKQLHLDEGLFVMPNAWDAGSACLLAAAGFSAIATTSAGIAFSHAMPDYEAVLSRDMAMETTRQIAQAVQLPVSIDGENGYGHEPEAVAGTIPIFAQTGAVAASIEDYSADYGKDLYEFDLAVERIAAARAAADALDFPFTITARAECYLLGYENAFAESVKRVNAYREAGADCLYVPGIKDIDTIRLLVQEVNGPVNVVMGLAGKPLSVSDLEDVGVKRVSIGGSLMRATLGLVRKAANEILHQGSFDYAAQQIADAELCEFYNDCWQRRQKSS